MDKLEFVTLDEAAKMQEGTRITFIPGVQALYAEALKNICYVKKIPIIRALHPMGCRHRPSLAKPAATGR